MYFIPEHQKCFLQSPGAILDLKKLFSHSNHCIPLYKVTFSSRSSQDTFMYTDVHLE